MGSVMAFHHSDSLYHRYSIICLIRLNLLEQLSDIFANLLFLDFFYYLRMFLKWAWRKALSYKQWVIL